MTRRSSGMLARAGAALCLISAVVLVVAPVPSGALEPEQVGWWQRDLPYQEDGSAASGGGASSAHLRGQVAPPTLPPPPVPPPTLPGSPEPTPTPPVNPPSPTPIPDGGLVVANDSFGASAVSALRFDGDEVGAAALTLQFAEGSTVLGPVVACPALSDWQPETNGEWRNRPAHDCQRVSVSGSVADDGTAMSWSLPATFKPEGAAIVDVVLLPAPEEGSTFQLVFAPPSGDAFTVLSGPPPSTTTSTLPPVPPDQLPPPADELPTGGVPALVDSAGGGGAGGGATPVAGGQPTVAFDGGTESALPAPFGAVAEAIDDVLGRRVAAGLLVAMGVGLAWTSSRPERMPRLLGALAANRVTARLVRERSPEARARGVGRFARPRAPTERPSSI